MGPWLAVQKEEKAKWDRLNKASHLDGSDPKNKTSRLRVPQYTACWFAIACHSNILSLLIIKLILYILAHTDLIKHGVCTLQLFMILYICIYIYYTYTAPPKKIEDGTIPHKIVKINLTCSIFLWGCYILYE